MSKQLIPALDNLDSLPLSTPLATSRNVQLGLLHFVVRNKQDESFTLKAQDALPRIARQTYRIPSLIKPKETHPDTHMQTQQLWESATYCFVISLGAWLSVLAVVVSRGPAAGIGLSVFRFTLLVGLGPRRAQVMVIWLLSTTLDLHLPPH